MPDRITLIHTADLHLGRSFQDLGRRGSRLRQRLLEALARTVALALDRSADLVLIAGDLFDSPAPAAGALAALEAGLARLAAAGVRTVVMPGTHDPPGSRVFGAPAFTRPERVTVLTPEAPLCVFPELDLAVGAWFPARERSNEWIGPAPGWRGTHGFGVLMAHGSALPGLAEEGPEDRLPPAVLTDPEAHYLALGHHHGAGLVAARMPAYYAGAPEMLAFNQKDAGHVLHVTLTRRGGEVKTEVERVRIGTLRYQRLEADAAELLTGRDLGRELAALADPDLYLDLTVAGIVPLDAQLPDLDALERDHAERFFKLRIQDRVSRGRDLSAAAPEASVLAEFIRRARERIDAAAGPEAEEWEEALRLGLHFLSGEDREC
jgi:DNA repair exonuclease SbcCD nuclease subunit